MPPKRKAASDIPGESPTKRVTRSAASTTQPPAAPPRVLRRADRPDNPAISVTTPQRPKTIITYSKRSSARRADHSADSLKENEKQEEPDGGEEKSNDELDTLSPTKLASERASKRLRKTSTELPVISPAKRSRRGKLLENTDTPIRTQSERGQSQSAPDSPSLSPSPKGKRGMELQEPSHDTPSSSSRVTRNSASPRKELQATKPKLTRSPKKKPLTATKKDNIERRDERRNYSDSEEDNAPSVRNAPSPRKQLRHGPQENADEPSKKAKTTAENPPSVARTSSRALARRPTNADAAAIPPSPGPLKFSSVMVPPVPKHLRHAAASISGTASPRRTPSLPPKPSSPLSLVETPTAPATVTPHASPSKKKVTTLSSPTRLPHVLPHHLHVCLNAQKRAILHALRHPPEFDDGDAGDGDEESEPSTNSVAAQQLTSLLEGTVSRGEGNSCLVLGPRGSGKSRLVEQCIAGVSGYNPAVLRLSGWTQHTDRLAMREVAYQLSQQTGTSFLPQIETGSPDDAPAEPGSEEENPFLDTSASSKLSLPSAHLPALISMIPTLNRPTIVILDGFDLFTLHPRQSLLYCLLDTVQSCRATAGSKGLAVIGITSRIDTITSLEKRVKSRFSGRMFRTAPPRTIQAWEKMARAVLSSEIDEFVGHQPEVEDAIAEWQELWDVALNQFLNDQTVQTVLKETFSVTRDFRMLSRLLSSVVLRLSPTSPSLSSSNFVSAAVAQRARPCFPLLHTLPYPHICLLIASVHADTAGQPTFTFEMLHEYFRDQVRASTSAPVQVNGGSIGMVRCSRQVLMAAFEDLISTKVFLLAAAYAPSVAKEFVKYRSVIDRESVKKAVDKLNQVNLKKWLTKAQ
ncbi:putative origin recognition complex (ORC) subunit 4 C-terminus [Lyophyllum shimeji]|uniref:Origin recognition complex (ORC) subunit 4 C-terminus n=1 Tax=Lyophyllum shimeji TaxID=47721 RepID=A0A9P3PE59_LYOSH|nr:putative origin recognition complex (ORC) subunit 4 C-terminus [Lyophyllum shimeji]